MQFYASPEQVQRDRSEYARKGIARGRSAVVLTVRGRRACWSPRTSPRCARSARSTTGSASPRSGRYNEFENLRAAGIRLADLRGYSYDRRDVTGRALANAYAQTLGAIFTDQTKPFEVEICVAEVGTTPGGDELYRITYDGSVGDEPGAMAMGGQSEAISTAIKAGHRMDIPLGEALALAVKALGSVGGENGAPRQIGANQLEVAVLERTSPRARVPPDHRRGADHLLGSAESTTEESEAELPPTTPPAKATKASGRPATANSRPSQGRVQAQGRAKPKDERQGQARQGEDAEPPL
jgi:proteasome alpha subunit